MIYMRFLLAVLTLSIGVHGEAVSLNCKRVLIGNESRAVYSRSPLNQIERNAPWLMVKGNYHVERKSGQNLNNTEAIFLAKQIANALPKGFLKSNSIVKIELVPEVSAHLKVPTPSGRLQNLPLQENGNLLIQKDPASDFLHVSVSESLFNLLVSKRYSLPSNSLSADFSGIPDFATTVYQPRWHHLWNGKSFYVGGLISLSAEPPEAFFAASTSAELKQSGYQLLPAVTADTWILRAPDAREDSFFKFQFPSSDRPADTDRSGKFLIVVGSGPAHNPATRGANEAQLIWLGDEQNGVLTNYLSTLSKDNISPEDFTQHSGFVQRLSSSSFWIGGIDKVNSLTKEGFSAQQTDPEIYRNIISSEYDQYLSSLFQDSQEVRSEESFLLATSRGCTQGCAICCSGGLSAFQYFTAERMVQELVKIDEVSRLTRDKTIDIFFVDSNFNNNPARIIEFARMMRDHPLRQRFRFFIRHNTANGFLLPEKDGFKSPNIELIKAYKSLGITEIMMGLDALDNASVMTLKTSRLRLARTGAKTRPIYSYEEINALIQAFEQNGMRSRGFLLTNNPWVSDLDRIDGYYNLLNVWMENPHFSIDARNREVLQLKPFEGSPIGDAAQRSSRDIVTNGRFQAKGPFGELDEAFNFFPFDKMRSQVGSEEALKSFTMALRAIRVRAAEILADPNMSAEFKKQAQLTIQKIIFRDASLLETLAQLEHQGSQMAVVLLKDIQSFQIRFASFSPFNPEEQKILLEEVARDLFDSLREGLPQ